jgi:polyisoprenoid-binding protein YceI
VVVEQTTASFVVRNFGLNQVRGTIKVTDGRVTVEDGQPVSGSASLDAASVSTGITRRDLDLTGKNFFAVAQHPAITVEVRDVRPDGAAWTALALITVAGGTAAVELRVRRSAEPADGLIRVIATGVLDRAKTPIRAPRAVVGRWVAIEVEATLRPLS